MKSTLFFFFALIKSLDSFLYTRTHAKKKYGCTHNLKKMFCVVIIYQHAKNVFICIHVINNSNKFKR